jgi:hypothetical protein
MIMTGSAPTVYVVALASRLPGDRPLWHALARPTPRTGRNLGMPLKTPFNYRVPFHSYHARHNPHGRNLE